MKELLIFMMISFSLSYIIVIEEVFKWFRKIFNFKPFTCVKCLSVWVGFILSYFFPIIYSIYLSWFFYGLISFTFTKIMLIYIDNRL